MAIKDIKEVFLPQSWPRILKGWDKRYHRVARRKREFHRDI